MKHTKNTARYLTAAAAAAALLLTGCGNPGAATSSTPVSSSAPASSAGGAEQKTLQFSFVQNNADWIDTREVQSTVGIWDETAGTTQEVASLKTDYPLQSVYCAADGSVIYYAARPDAGSKNDNLLCAYDTKTGETKTLLNGDDKGENGKKTLYGIDYIAPLDDHQLYMTAGTGGGVIAPMSYDLTSGELTKWDWDGDIFVSNTFQEPQTGTVYVSGYSDKEDSKLLGQLNDGKIEEYGVDSTVYALNADGSYEAVYTSKEWTIDDFVVSGFTIVTAQSRISNSKSKHRIIAYDTTNKAETELFADKQVNGNMIALSEDGAALYVEYGGLVKVNLSTGKETILYRPEASKPAIEFSNARVLA